jgi:hypothetical protein
MELNLHPIATKSFVSGHEFVEHERVVSYLVRPAARPGAGTETGPAVARYDLLESEDAAAFGQGDFRLHSQPAAGPELLERAFVYCRWVVGYKPRRDDNSALALKLTAENLFLTLAAPEAEPSSANTPLLQFLALMLERKKLIKLRGLTEDGQRHIYEHMPSHQLYEVPVGDLNVEFFQKIQEHLGVLVGTPKPKAEPAPAAVTTAAVQA